MDQHTANDLTTVPDSTTSQADQTSPDKIRVVLTVQGLTERPYIGSGCCVVTAADAIEQELDTWPFVVAATVDEHASEVDVTMQASAADLETILEVLGSMGYPALVR